jgi:hypothetical protein
MPNGRCRLHGGRSTGPRSEAGRERIATARTTHGWWGEEGRTFRCGIALLLEQGRVLRQLGKPGARPLRRIANRA